MSGINLDVNTYSFAKLFNRRFTPSEWADAISALLTAQRAGRDADLLIEDIYELRRDKVLGHWHTELAINKLAENERSSFRVSRAL